LKYQIEKEEKNGFYMIEMQRWIFLTNSLPRLTVANFQGNNFAAE
jgi:hypothetical protein